MPETPREGPIVHVASLAPLPRPDTEVRYAIDGEDRLVWTDAAWDRFALDNASPELAGGRVRGRRLWDMVQGTAVKDVYQRLLREVRAGRDRSVSLRCDSPALRRTMTLTLRAEGTGGRVLFCCQLEHVEPRPPVALLDPRLRERRGLLTVCSWCKRTEVGERWVELETAVGELGLLAGPHFAEALGGGRFPELSHTICPECSQRFAGGLTAG